MSDPFAPPGPQQPVSQPQAAVAPPQWQYPPSGQQWTSPVAVQSFPQAAFPAQKQGNGLAITAVILSGLALVGVLALAVFLFVGPGSGSGLVLTGEVTPVDSGVVAGSLEKELTRVIEDDGGSVDELHCPERSQVGQGLVTVCHGSVDGLDWTGIVVFEEADGRFVLTES